MHSGSGKTGIFTQNNKCVISERDECCTSALAFAIVKCEWLQVIIFSVYIYAVLQLQIQSSLNKYLGGDI